MKTSRIARFSARGAAAGGVAVLILAAAPPGASAQDELPTYRCEITSAELPDVTGSGICQALHGAPEQGPVEGPFVITSWRAMPFLCEAGEADVPSGVVGRGCVDADG